MTTSNEEKVPEEIDTTQQQVFLLICRDGEILDLSVVGDGLFGKTIKQIVMRHDSPLEPLPVANDLAPGYRAYALKEPWIENLTLLKLSMNLLTPEEFHAIADLLDLIGPKKPGDIVQFYGCF